MSYSVPVPDCDILKVGHHASRTASSAEYLNIARPEVAVYMAGVGNTYGHPHAETVAALQGIGATIYGTDVSGTIVVTTNTTALTVESLVLKKSPLLPLWALYQMSLKTLTYDTTALSVSKV